MKNPETSTAHPYLVVWFGLVLLFGLSLTVSFVFSPAVATSLVLCLASAKACLVAMYYMRLIESPRYMSIIALGALACIAILLIALIPDIVIIYGKPD